MGGTLMPFTNNRVYYIAAIIVVIILVALVVSAASQTPNRTNIKPSSLVTVTIYNAIGVQSMEIINENNDQHWTASTINLPIQFNCTRNDQLTINVVAKPGYSWNGWWFSPIDKFMGHDNPSTIIMGYNNQIGDITNNNEIIMIPACIKNTVASPTPSPTPTPTVSPTPVE
jgi:hypothetical protein